MENKTKKMYSFEIDFWDHLALRVKDLEIATTWYKQVLGLIRYRTPEWGAYPGRGRTYVLWKRITVYFKPVSY